MVNIAENKWIVEVTLQKKYVRFKWFSNTKHPPSFDLDPSIGCLASFDEHYLGDHESHLARVEFPTMTGFQPTLMEHTRFETLHLT